jgi:putative endopeptidase
LKLTKRLGEQYSKYEPVKGTFVNGTFTMGENIADLGGVNIALMHLKCILKTKEVGKIDGLPKNKDFS